MGIEGAMGRLMRLRDGIPGAVGEGLEPGRWLSAAKWHAEVALRGMAQGYEIGLIPRFVATVSTAVWGGPGKGLAISAGWDSGSSQGIVGRARAAKYGSEIREYPGEVQRRRRVPAALPIGVAQELEQLRQGIRDWVREEKRKDAKEEGLGDEQIAENIMFILGVHERSDPLETSPDLEAARAALTPHIEAFMVAGDVEGRSGLTAERASEWLKAILKAWREMVLREAPAVLLQEIRRLRGRIGRELF